MSCAPARRRSTGADTIAVSAYNAGFGVGWEIDFWGKFRRSIEAADAGYFASIAQYDDLQVLMAAQAASFYCCDPHHRTAAEDRPRKRRAAEAQPGDHRAAVQAAATNPSWTCNRPRPSTWARWPPFPQLEGSLRQTQNALGVLLPGPRARCPRCAEGKDTIPQAELGVIVDMPADLLRRRPDVRAAEMQLAAQSALIGVSEADLYPSIALLGSLGLSATSLDGSPRTLAWGIGPSLVWNVFDHGRLTERGAGAGRALPAALRAVSGLRYCGQRARSTTQRSVSPQTARRSRCSTNAVKAAQRSLDIANIQYREGLSDFQRVLDSQRTLFSQQERLVSTAEQRDAEPDRPVQGDGRRLGTGPWPARSGRRDPRNHGRAQQLEGACLRRRCRRPLPSPQLIQSGTSKAMDQELTPSRTSQPLGA